jgi:hypothetical protein
LNLHAKARLGAVVGNANPSPIERVIQRFFWQRDNSYTHLISLIRTVTPKLLLRFSGLKPLSNGRKGELFVWLEEKWERIGPVLSHLIEEEEERNGIQRYLE